MENGKLEKNDYPSPKKKIMWNDQQADNAYASEQGYLTGRKQKTMALKNCGTTISKVANRKTRSAKVAFFSSPPLFSSQQFSDFSCFGAVSGPVGIKRVAFWPCFARNPEIFDSHLRDTHDYNFGLYRDDGLGITKASPRQTEKVKQKILSKQDTQIINPRLLMQIKGTTPSSVNTYDIWKKT